VNQHSQSNKILAPVQFGFRNGTDIENATFTLMDTLPTSLNHQMQMVGIFCDLIKAFGCVKHVIPLNK
jgi:hypothetical protein